MINELSTLTPLSSVPPGATNPLSALSKAESKKAHSLLTTLHCLFPHELLPALDLLDRGLVARFTCASESTDLSSTPTNINLGEVFHVQSASAVQPTGTSSRYAKRPMSTPTAYEVRLKAWNCSCPAFTFSAFGKGSDLEAASSKPDDEPNDENPGQGYMTDDWWLFGGNLTSGSVRSVPICKHLLACLLGTRAQGLFGGGVEEKRVSLEEMAGWGAGWGG